MKYLSYTARLVWMLIRKFPFIGIPMTFLAIPFRAYARNTVYNYVLANGVYLKRLLERPIIEHDDYYEIQPYHDTQGGYIKKRRVSIGEYQFAYYILWQWLDDDSWFDTWSMSYNESIVGTKSDESFRLQWLPEFIKESLRQDLGNASLGGNSFDIGDKRAEVPMFGFWSVLLWSIRNTAYNSKYMTWEENRPEYLFYHKIGTWNFGYLPDGKRKGRMVYGWYTK